MLLLVLLTCCFQTEIRFSPDRDLVSAGPFAPAERAGIKLRVYVAQQCPPQAEAMAMLGRQYWREDRLLFEPEFGFQAGMSYCAILEWQSGQRFGESHQYAKVKALPATHVVAIYPSSDVLPANHLRFYVNFSGPMQTGKVYDHIKLLDASGNEVRHAFFQDQAALWDPQYRRFTLYFDPSRVKRGLLYRHEVGPILAEGKRYRLVIDRAWRDAQGQPMIRSFEKDFLAGPPDYQSPEQARWRVSQPALGTREPLVIDFPAPLDYALLQHAIWPLDDAEQALEGRVSVTNEEQRWLFTPAQPWQSQPRLRVDSRLADGCGNSIEAPFERDLSQ